MASPEDWSAREARILDRVLERVRSDPQFGAEDEEALRILIKAYRGWAALGWFGKWVIYLLAAVAGAITAYKTVAEAVRAWLLGT